MNRKRSVIVQILTPDGDAVSGATVRVGWHRHGHFEELTRTASDAAGLATLDGLDPGGTYELATHGGSLSDAYGIALFKWTLQDTQLRASRIVRPRLDVQDETGASLACNAFWRRPGLHWQRLDGRRQPWLLPATPADAEIQVRFEDDAFAPTTASAKVSIGRRWIAVARRR